MYRTTPENSWLLSLLYTASRLFSIAAQWAGTSLLMLTEQLWCFEQQAIASFKFNMGLQWHMTAKDRRPLLWHPEYHPARSVQPTSESSIHVRATCLQDILFSSSTSAVRTPTSLCRLSVTALKLLGGWQISILTKMPFIAHEEEAECNTVLQKLLGKNTIRCSAEDCYSARTLIPDHP